MIIKLASAKIIAMKRESYLLRIKPKSGKSRTPITAAIYAVTLDSEIILPR